MGADIDPERLYSMAECRRLLPGGRDGKGPHLDTLRKWRKSGLLQAVKVGGRYFARGEELVRLLGKGRPVAPPPAVTAARFRQRQRAAAALLWGGKAAGRAGDHAGGGGGRAGRGAAGAGGGGTPPNAPPPARTSKE